MSQTTPGAPDIFIYMGEEKMIRSASIRRSPSINITLSLTAGNNPVDIEKLIVSARTSAVYNPSVFNGSIASQYEWVQSVNTNNLLERFEKAQLTSYCRATSRLVPTSGLASRSSPRPALSCCSQSPPLRRSRVSWYWYKYDCARTGILSLFRAGSTLPVYRFKNTDINDLYSVDISICTSQATEGT